MNCNKDMLKAVALAIYIKNHVCSSLIKNWSVSKIASITSLNPKTVKKRLDKLSELNLIKVQGKNLLFLSMKSSCNRNNINIDKLNCNKVKEIEKGLGALLVVLIQRCKDYANLQLQCAHNGKTIKDVKRGMRKSKLYGWSGSYIEHGLSYKGIAKRLGVCIKTAFELVKYGIAHGFFTKITHFYRAKVKGAGNLKDVPQGYTFISKKTGNLWKVSSNTYSLSPVFSICL